MYRPQITKIFKFEKLPDKYKLQIWVIGAISLGFVVCLEIIFKSADLQNLLIIHSHIFLLAGGGAHVVCESLIHINLENDAKLRICFKRIQRISVFGIIEYCRKIFIIIYVINFIIKSIIAIYLIVRKQLKSTLLVWILILCSQLIVQDR